eukprot:scaffold68590_cov62-Phaeocystis_antarctica.AAC.1
MYRHCRRTINVGRGTIAAGRTRGRSTRASETRAKRGGSLHCWLLAAYYRRTCKRGKVQLARTRDTPSRSGNLLTTAELALAAGLTHTSKRSVPARLGRRGDL